MQPNLHRAVNSQTISISRLSFTHRSACSICCRCSAASRQAETLQTFTRIRTFLPISQTHFAPFTFSMNKRNENICYNKENMETQPIVRGALPPGFPVATALHPQRHSAQRRGCFLSDWKSKLVQNSNMGTEKPNGIPEKECDSPKLVVSYAITAKGFIDPSPVALQLRAPPKVSATAPAHRSYHFRGVKLKSCIKKIHHNLYISKQANVRIKHVDTEGASHKKFGTDARVQ